MGPEMLCPENSGSALEDIFVILHNEKGEGTHENQIIVFWFFINNRWFIFGYACCIYYYYY